MGLPIESGVCVEFIRRKEGVASEGLVDVVLGRVSRMLW